MNSKTVLKNQITRKLKDESGASITYALLLFLVCAALCAVIIAAGTAAAGRLAKIAETDQRYYAVTSAAELLSEELGSGGLSVLTLSTGTAENPDTVSFAKSMEDITDADFRFTDPETGKENDVTAANDKNLVVPATDASNGLAASIFNANKNDEFTLTSGSGSDPLAVSIRIDDKTESSVLIAVQDKAGGTTGKGHFKVFLKYEVNEQESMPPVTKLANGIQITGGKEISWDLAKMMTSYDQ